MEAPGGFNCILAGQRVRNQEHFGRIGDGGDFGRLDHHLLVDRRAARCVEEEDVIAADLRCLHGAPGDVRGGLARDDRQRADIRPCLLREDRELLHRRRAANVQRGEKDAFLAAVGKPLGNLAGCRGFARALKARHHHDGRGNIDAKMRLFLIRAEHFDEGVIDDLDDLLARLDRPDDFLADSAGAHLFDEILHHRQRDVCLEQGDADLAQRLVHVLVGQRAAAGQAVKDTS